MNSKKYLAFFAGSLALVLMAIAVSPALAATDTQQPPAFGQPHGRMMRPGGPGMKPGVFGQVTAINGSSLSIASRGFGKASTTTAFTVDATNATVIKNNATSTVSAIVVGDTISAQGTINGTNVVATIIRDGMMRGGGMGMMGKRMGTSTLPTFKGDGQPIVAGTISSISGSTISVTNSGNTTYSVDATNATVIKNNATSSVSSLATGDTVVVQGTINGTSVAATSIIDHIAKTQTQNQNSEQAGNHQGFFGGMGQFFMHLFHF